MDRRLRKEIDRWLAAEAAGDDTTAETAFGASFARLPRLAPRPGFAERVTWAAVPEAVRPALGERGWKIALAVSMALAGLATAFLPALRLLPIGPGSLGGVLRAGNDALAWMAGRVADGVAVWDFLGQVGGAVAVAASTPEATAALFGSAIVSGLALYTLHRLLSLERRIIG